MERDTEIIQAARSMVVHLPALLGERADSVGAQLDLLLAEWDREPNPSVIDRILALLEGSAATREWMAGFLRLSAPAPARTRGLGLASVPEATETLAPAPPVSVRGIGRDETFSAPEERRSLRGLAGWGSDQGGLSYGPAPADDGQAPADQAEPPGTAYGLLSCPETVAVGQEFDLEVGLSEHSSPGVGGGSIDLPTSAGKTYTLSVQLLIFGFRLRVGESAQQTMQVSATTPYPTVTLHLTPEAQDEASSSRRIKAMYSVDGQPVGFAVRYVTVRRTGTPLPGQTPTASGENLSIPSAPAPADLTVVVEKKPGSSGELAWVFQSPHGLDLPDEPVFTDIGTSPQDFARNLTNHLSTTEGQPGVFLTIRGKGREIARHMPPEFWRLLKEAAQSVVGPPTVLFLTDQPYIPWELATLSEPLEGGKDLPLFLCAQSRVGRWLQPDENAAAAGLGPAQPPPTRLQVATMAVVSGVYGQPGVPRLKEAEAECAELADRYGAATVDAKAGAVFAFIAGGPPTAEILHFAMHGKWDPSGAQDGLILVDGMLSSDQVEGGDLPGRPLVFLNACQVGQASEVLGDYAGMAAAFLKAGASAVIAPLWSIDDATARSIALSFYRETLENGATPAEVIRRVRAGFKPDVDAQSSTYMAYQFFGDPRLELVNAYAAPNRSGRR